MERLEINKKWIGHINKERIKIMYKGIGNFDYEKIITVAKNITISNFGRVSDSYRIKQYNLEYFYEETFYDIYRMISELSYDLTPTPYSNGGYDSYEMHKLPVFKGKITEEEGIELFHLIDRFAQENYYVLPETLSFEDYNNRTQEWFYDDVVKVLETNYPECKYTSTMESSIFIRTDDGEIIIPNHPYLEIEYTLKRNRKVYFDTIVQLKRIKQKQKEKFEEPYTKIRKEIKTIQFKLNKS